MSVHMHGGRKSTHPDMMLWNLLVAGNVYGGDIQLSLLTVCCPGRLYGSPPPPPWQCSVHKGSHELWDSVEHNCQ